MIEAHTTFGAEILVQTDGLRPLTPTVALEHHREVVGAGYPDLGTAAPRHEPAGVGGGHLRGDNRSRSYQNPTPPEHACLILARLAGKKPNTALVKAFVKAITFFPIGSLVRTSHDEFGVVVQTNGADPLHPVIAITENGFRVAGSAGRYQRPRRRRRLRAAHRRDTAGAGELRHPPVPAVRRLSARSAWRSARARRPTPAVRQPDDR